MSLGQRMDAARTSWWLRGCECADSETRLHGRPSMNFEGGRIRLGRRCGIGSVPVTSHFVAGPGAVLDIGDDVIIGHGAAIAAFERVEIGRGTRIAPFAIVMDTNFHGGSGDQSVHHDCRPVRIGSDCRIGSRVTITRGVTIGDGAEVLAGSVVSSSIPAGACAGGARARILGRAGDPAVRWEGTAAMVPLVMMETFSLPSAPDRDLAVGEIPGWTTDRLAHLSAGLSRQFAVRVPIPHLAAAQRVSDIIEAVERERQSGEAR
jgi:acetyltransferase-like isoleucine patch superfamily enzyme